uniref:hypothetical protein n=1 Tax=Lentilactobacillus hilgardii TaxID=1588 RepID=UPI00403F7C68
MIIGTLTSNNWITILCTVITALVSIGSIFVSNFVGQHIYKTKLSISNKKERYTKLYLPAIKLLYQYLPNHIDYGHFQLTRATIARASDSQKLWNRDPLVSLIMDNAEYASPTLLTKCNEYSYLANTNFLFNDMLAEATDHPEKRSERRDKLLDKVARKHPEANIKFNALVKQLLSESKTIAKSIRATDLSEPILKALEKDSSYE